MTSELAFGLLFLLLLLASLGIWSLFNSPSEYEWRKHMAAKRAWKKLLEDK